MMHRLSLMNISLFTTMIAFNLTPSSLLSKNGVSLRNPSYPTKGGFISVFSSGTVQRPVVMIRARRARRQDVMPPAFAGARPRMHLRRCAPRMPARCPQAAPQSRLPARTNQTAPPQARGQRGCGTAEQEKRRGGRAGAAAHGAEKPLSVREAADAGAEAGALCPLAEEAPPVLLRTALRRIHGGAVGADGDAVHRHGPGGHAVFIAGHGGNGVQHVHTGNHLAEHGVLPVQVRARRPRFGRRLPPLRARPPLSARWRPRGRRCPVRTAQNRTG